VICRYYNDVFRQCTELMRACDLFIPRWPIFAQQTELSASNEHNVAAAADLVTALDSCFSVWEQFTYDTLQ